jgi:hypothetical protein
MLRVPVGGPHESEGATLETFVPHLEPENANENETGRARIL